MGIKRDLFGSVEFQTTRGLSAREGLEASVAFARGKVLVDGYQRYVFTWPDGRFGVAEGYSTRCIPEAADLVLTVSRLHEDGDLGDALEFEGVEVQAFHGRDCPNDVEGIVGRVPCECPVVLLWALLLALRLVRPHRPLWVWWQRAKIKLHPLWLYHTALRPLERHLERRYGWAKRGTWWPYLHAPCEFAAWLRFRWRWWLRTPAAVRRYLRADAAATRSLEDAGNDGPGAA